MLVVYHCGIETARLSVAAGGGSLFNVDPWGEGVPIFFAISGFIMVVTSADEFGSPSAAIHFMHPVKPRGTIREAVVARKPLYRKDVDG